MAKDATVVKPEDPAAEYQPTPNERTVLTRQLARSRAEAPIPQLEIAPNGTSIAPNHPNEDVARKLILEALGTANPEFGDALVQHIIDALTDSRDGINLMNLNFVLAVVKETKSGDPLLTMHYVQMALIHIQAMRYSRKLLGELGMASCGSGAERPLISLVRTYTAQLDAAHRYKSGDQQNITLQQNVSIGDVEKATANLNTAPRSAAEHSEQNFRAGAAVPPH